VSVAGRQNNFDKAKKGVAEGQGVDYDYRSVMHYTAGAFSKNGRPTIEPKVHNVLCNSCTVELKVALVLN
jgi:hypothetical protein